MKAVLISKIKQMIVQYVIRYEGSFYRGGDYYNSFYIQKRSSLASHIKKHIDYLDKCFKDKTLSEIAFFEKVYRYLKNIKVGYMLFWFIPIETKNIELRRKIYHALWIHDSELFKACENNTVTQLECFRHFNQSSKDASPVVSTQEGDESMKEYYKKLTDENNQLKTQLQLLEKNLAEERKKNVILQEHLQQLLQTNEMLKHKVETTLLRNKQQANHATVFKPVPLH
ncbi:MAG: hypothetical protein A3E82_05705 [Gammaproteobacteria bacterium RIFCSPHIGHO2_12_FULL_38_11]|nr:MAG: hypothetical protein A3E82_05705 [Gammaproteobacteria bacterium RIFCSPHIGHO2_12_FULL_38_11]